MRCSGATGRGKGSSPTADEEHQPIDYVFEDCLKRKSLTNAARRHARLVGDDESLGSREIYDQYFAQQRETNDRTADEFCMHFGAETNEMYDEIDPILFRDWRDVPPTSMQTMLDLSDQCR